MNFSSLSATDRQIVIAAAVAALMAILSFFDPSGSWGPIMILALAGAAAALFVVIQPQLAPSTKLPAPRGLSLLVAGIVAAGGFGIAVLTYLAYIFRNLIDPFVIMMAVGLIASIVVAVRGWQAYQAEPKAAPGGAAPATQAPPPPPAEPPATQA